jgi:hypothetical protein
VSPPAQGWIDWCKQAHQRRLPLAVLDEVEALEDDPPPEDEEDDKR